MISLLCSRCSAARSCWSLWASQGEREKNKKVNLNALFSNRQPVQSKWPCVPKLLFKRCQIGSGTEERPWLWSLNSRSLFHSFLLRSSKLMGLIWQVTQAIIPAGGWGISVREYSTLWSCAQRRSSSSQNLSFGIVCCLSSQKDEVRYRNK